MDPKALIKANSRLRIAQKTLGQLAGVNDHQEFSDAWYTLLVSSKAVWTSLEQGAKASARSRQWFGGKKRERRSDPLLQYMFEARNDDEHGLDAVLANVSPLSISTKPFGVKKRTTFTAVVFDGATDEAIGFLGHDDDGNRVEVPIETATREVLPPRTVLAPIRNRGGHLLAPPILHLGQAVHTNDPVAIAEMNLGYLSRLVEEAEGFRTP